MLFATCYLLLPTCYLLLAANLNFSTFFLLVSSFYMLLATCYLLHAIFKLQHRSFYSPKCLSVGQSVCQSMENLFNSKNQSALIIFDYLINFGVGGGILWGQGSD